MRFNLPSLIALAGLTAAQVSTVENDFSSIKSAVASLTTSLQNYQGGSGGAVALLKPVGALIDQIKSTNSDAQSLGTVSESDQYSLLTAAQGLYPGIISSLDAYVTAYAKIPASLQSTADGQVQMIQTATDALAQTLIGKATGSYQTDAQQLGSAIDAAFKSALSHQAPTSSSLPSPTPPSGGSSPGTTTGSGPTTTGGAQPVTTPATTPSKTTGGTVPPPITSTPKAPTYSGAAALNKAPFIQAAALVVAAAAL